MTSESIPRYQLTIDGQRTAAGDLHPVINPATGELCGSVPECTTEQLDEALRAAQRSFTAWKADEQLRCEALRVIADALQQQRERLASVITSEQGKPVREALTEVAMASAWFAYYADRPISSDTVADDDRRRVTINHRPAGVVAAITPWNFPLSNLAWKLAPALRAGSTVVLKPSPFTPMTALELDRLMQAVLPQGVVAVLTGGDALGAALVAHPIPRHISVTGSVETGKAIAAVAARDLKHTTLELGGNDAAIVLDDVDPARVVKRLFWGAFYNCGQVCTAIKRVYVPETLHADIVGRLAELASTMVVGPGAEADTRIGPVSNQPQLERVALLVEEALDAGAVAAAGGNRIDGPGNFFAPTVLTDVTDEMRIVSEEQFGPALPILSYDVLDDAIAAANATMVALGGSVWSSDPDRAAGVAGNLDCGTVWINGHNMLSPEQPFGGRKWSGLGVENGQLGLMEYLDPVVTHESLV